MRIGCELSGARQKANLVVRFVGFKLTTFKCSVEGCELGANCQGPSKQPISLSDCGLKDHDFQVLSGRVRIGCELSGAKQTANLVIRFVGFKLTTFKCSVEGCELGANCQGPSKQPISLLGLWASSSRLSSAQWKGANWVRIVRGQANSQSRC